MNTNERHQKIVDNALFDIEGTRAVFEKHPSYIQGKILMFCSDLWKEKATKSDSVIKPIIITLAKTLIRANYLEHETNDDEKYLVMHCPTSAGEYWREGIKQVIDHSFKKEYQMAYRSLERFCLGQRIDFLDCLEG